MVERFWQRIVSEFVPHRWSFYWRSAFDSVLFLNLFHIVGVFIGGAVLTAYFS